MPNMTRYLPMLERILGHYGQKTEIEKCREECLELAQALEGYPMVFTHSDVVSEIADTLITATIAAHIFGEQAVVDAIEFKLRRQEARMEGES